jgi:hypothetical protein
MAAKRRSMKKSSGKRKSAKKSSGRKANKWVKLVTKIFREDKKKSGKKASLKKAMMKAKKLY